MGDEPDLDPTSLDVGLLALFVGFAAQQEVADRLRGRGHPDARFSHGFLLQHLVDGPRTMSDLARRQEVSVQAVSKQVAELTETGYLTTSVDPEDRRGRLVALTKRARDSIAIARRERAAQQRRIERRLGHARATALRADLAEVLDLLGGADPVALRRVRMPG